MYQKDPIPTYEQAFEALKEGDDDTLAAALFACELEDGHYIEQVTKAIRGLLRRGDLAPSQIVTIGRALHGLARMPLRTPGLDIHISLLDKFNNEATSYDFFISSDRFATESGGYVDSGHGSDSFSGPTFQVEAGFRDYTGIDIIGERWSDVFSEMTAAELHVQDDSDDSLLDWEHPDGSQFWQWIAEHD